MSRWSIGWQEESVRSGKEWTKVDVQIKQIKFFPVKDKQTKEILRSDDGRPVFGKLRNLIFRVNLEYKCHDGSTELSWIIWTQYGYNWHYPNQADGKPSTPEGSKPRHIFAEWLEKKIKNKPLANEVMNLFAQELSLGDDGESLEAA